jgi:enoyl-CoA hydratase/carnithine racemase
MAMPETNIGLFPDVGGGFFLSRTPGHLGEYLALTGQMLVGGDALSAGLADGLVASDSMPELWTSLTANTQLSAIERFEQLADLVSLPSPVTAPQWQDPQIDSIFALPTVMDMINALEQTDGDWAAQTLAGLRQRSPLMLHVSLEQIRRGRQLTMAEDLRMERNIVHHCFNTEHLGRSGTSSETVEGIRALAVDKDHAPNWNPARIEDITNDMIEPFFASPWSEEQHPLKDLD